LTQASPSIEEHRGYHSKPHPPQSREIARTEKLSLPLEIHEHTSCKFFDALVSSFEIFSAAARSKEYRRRPVGIASGQISSGLSSSRVHIRVKGREQSLKLIWRLRAVGLATFRCRLDCQQKFEKLEKANCFKNI
jgi:hypothetical protein